MAVASAQQLFWEVVLDEVPLYTISLQDYPDLPDAERERAQRRCARTLERVTKLGRRAAGRLGT